MNIKEFVFEPKISAEAMAGAKKCLEALGKENSGRGSRTNFFTVYDNGTSTRFFQQGCHYSIGHGQFNDGKRELVVTEGNGWNRRTGVTRDEVMPFATYLTQMHHLGRFIVNRDDIDECLDKGYVISADIPGPWLQNLCIMTRHFYEVEGCSFRKFNELIEQGIDPDLAYLCTMNTGFSLMTQSNPGEGTLRDDYAITSYGGHRATSMLGLKALENFVKGECSTKKDVQNWRDNQLYSGGSMMYEPIPKVYGQKTDTLPADLLQNDDFKKVLSAYRKESTAGEMYRPPNPFTRKFSAPAGILNGLPEGNGMTNKEFFTVAVPFVNELVKEWRRADDSRAIAA